MKCQEACRRRQETSLHGLSLVRDHDLNDGRTLAICIHYDRYTVVHNRRAAPSLEVAEFGWEGWVQGARFCVYMWGYWTVPKHAFMHVMECDLNFLLMDCGSAIM